MGAFLIRQMDYSLFCNGLSLFLTALTATVFARRTRSKTSMPPDFPWPCLALFGVLHGLENWMELLALSLGDRSFLQALSPGLHLAGLFSLFEFGRRGLSCGGLRPLGKGLWPILLCMEGIFALLGPRELLVGTGYLLGLLGGLFVGGALFLHQGKIRFGRSSFFLFLSALTLHAALGALLAGKAPFFPLNLLRDDGLNHPFPIGLLTVSALLALIMSVSLSLYLNESRRGDLPAWQGVARLRYRIAGILIFPALLLLGWIGVELSGNREEASMERQLLRQVKSVAAAVDPEEVKRLSGGPEDLKRPEYGHVRRILRNVRQIGRAHV